MQNTFLLLHGSIVAPDRIIEGGSILIREGHIEEIFESDPAGLYPGVAKIDCTGKWILPGVMDLHTDALEKEISPRPRAHFDLDVAFNELERNMCGCGYHTVYHSLYLGYTPAESNVNIPRVDFFRQTYTLTQADTLLRNKIHLRFEITGVAEYENCLQLVNEGKIELLSFMDHTPGQGQYSRENFFRDRLKSGKSLDEAQEEFDKFQAVPRLNGEQLAYLAEFARNKGVILASHDDDTPEKIDEMLQLGVTICEFPINDLTAQYAHHKGMVVIGGAANVLRGGSLSGNLHVADAIQKGWINCLVSDYYPPAMIHSVFKLSEERQIPLVETANLVSLAPAKAMGLDTHTGSIEKGKWADLLVIGRRNKVPFIRYNFVHGHIVSQKSLPPKIRQPYGI